MDLFQDSHLQWTTFHGNLEEPENLLWKSSIGSVQTYWITTTGFPSFPWYNRTNEILEALNYDIEVPCVVQGCHCGTPRPAV